MSMNVCVVGCGAIGPIHIKALNDSEYANIYAVCDVIPERADKFASEYGAKAFYKFEECLTDPDIDAIHICTPHHLHYKMISESLDAGKTVVSEKPLVMKKEEFDQLLKRDDLDKLCAVIQNRFNNSVIALKELVDSQKFGKVIGARAFVTWNRTDEYYASEEWRGKWDTEGGGVLINQTIHTLDYFCHIAGGIKSVKANMYNYSHQNSIEVEDTMVAYITLRNDAPAIFMVTNSYVENSTPLFEITFEKGNARYVDNALWVNGEAIAVDQIAQTAKPYWGMGHKTLIDNFYGQGKFYGINDVKNTMESVFAIYESAKFNGKSINV